MGDKEDYLTTYRVFFENFAATVNPEDQLPVHIAGYSITEAELPGEVLYWTTQYLTEKLCPHKLLTPLRRIILDEVQVASKKSPLEFGYNSDESVYIALRLMQAVTARVNAICLRYLDNSQLDTLPPPPALTRREVKTVSCATKNLRRVMEDRHIEIDDLEAFFGIQATEPTSFYAVYDGHAGSAAATYCAAHLHQYLVESPNFKTNLWRALIDAFHRTDADFIRKNNHDRANGGSTAVAVVIRGRQLYAAWVGDSLALLAKRMQLLQLVQPHKPDREDERERIEKSGGTVMHFGTWRVNGQLAVSRAIGDAQYKPYVTATPEINTVNLDGNEDFVVVACDGLWDYVTEDVVTATVYSQLAADPDDLKAVTKRLTAQAKRYGSSDNISIIVVFLKDPRDIVADNLPMDLGLENAGANAPPFGMEAEARKGQSDAASGTDSGPGACADNGVENSDSDSEDLDLGPETAVDADDLDAAAGDAAPPTPPANHVERGHVDGVLVDNVAESGEESEDEWNYFKGEGDREEHNPIEEPDEQLRSETPCQDNSAWESSSVDMNSSPLNPDAPVFIPGSVAGGDVLLAQSPRKPLPMDDIELPNRIQFETEAVVRPSELLDLDNCDQLNGHHDEAKEQLNGNNKFNMNSLGFGFEMGPETEKITDTGLIQDFERIQKDTTDFCNIQVFQAHTETNPFASADNDELLERLKNKERDPMSMSFYQEKDDDTCERLLRNDQHVDLNAVQPIPDSDDEEDIQTNGTYNLNEFDKENINPEQHLDILGSGNISEPNNDIMRFDERIDPLANNVPVNFGHADNFMDNNVISNENIQNYNNDFESSNLSQEDVVHTDTPESHKLLYEQIPEIPDGKSSELGFTTDDLLDQTESEKDARILTPQDELSQDIDMESNKNDSPCIDRQEELTSKAEEDQHTDSHSVGDNIDDIYPESELLHEANLVATERLPASPLPMENRLTEVISPDVHSVEGSVKVDVHQNFELVNTNDDLNQENFSHVNEETPVIKVEAEDFAIEAEITDVCSRPMDSPVPTESPSHSPLPSDSHSPAPIDSAFDGSTMPATSPIPTEFLGRSPTPQSQLPKSPILTESPVPAKSPVPVVSPIPVVSPVPVETPTLDLATDSGQIQVVHSPLTSEPPFPEHFMSNGHHEEIHEHAAIDEQSIPTHSPLPAESPFTPKSPAPAESPLPPKSPAPAESPLPPKSPAPAESHLPSKSPVLAESHLPSVSPVPAESPLPPKVPELTESPVPPTLAESPLPPKSPAFESSVSQIPTHSPIPCGDLAQVESRMDITSPVVTDQITESLAPQTEQSLDRLTPELAEESKPDIVPDVPKSDLVTDIDIGIPESRAQEICVPVTNEIEIEEAVKTGGLSTPPPTPAVDALITAPKLDIAPITETPIAADAALAATAAAATAAIAATVAAKKSPTTKKYPTTSTPNSPAKPLATPSPRTITKKPTTTTPVPATKTTPAKTPSSASKPAAKPAPSQRLSAKAPVKESLGKSAPVKEAATKPAPTKAPVPKAPITKTAVTKTTAPKPPAPVKATARPTTAPTRPLAPKVPTTRPATTTARPKPAEVKPRAAEKKPLTNGDAKEAKPAAKPAPRPMPRPAPRPATTAAATATTKAAAPKAAPRAPAAPRVPAARPLDKQTKDLANKRITAKAAPPRTAATKAPTAKSVPTKVTKKPEGVPAPKRPTSLANGSAPAKAPPSPPAQSDALLPDVIA
ncbi:hypothetical protein ACJJTC_006634 [Scirpophaga incertulas]